MNAPLSITGLGALSALGHDLPTHREAMLAGRRVARRLGELEACPAGFSDLPAAWIEPRSLLTHRKWSPATMAALHAAREAVGNAAWTAAERREAVVFAGTSRGTIAGWLEPWPARRPLPLMAASNSLASEPAAAVSSELGIGGPWQVFSSGCCAGLDALGFAALWLRSGLAPRALVIAVDLPLVAPMLHSYATTGILASDLLNDPWSPSTTGMIPAEGAAAICLEAASTVDKVRLHSYLSTAGSDDPLGTGTRSTALQRLLEMAVEGEGVPAAFIPHASGTRGQSLAEPAAIHRRVPATLLPLKPWTGHTIGASGLLESVILCHWLAAGALPPAPPGITRPPGFPMTTPDLPPRSKVFKLSSAMGGKHSLITFESPA